MKIGHNHRDEIFAAFRQMAEDVIFGLENIDDRPLNVSILPDTPLCGLQMCVTIKVDDA